MTGGAAAPEQSHPAAPHVADHLADLDRTDAQRADRAWAYRYSHPARMRADLALLVDGPRRSTLVAFVAWREQRLAEALAIAGELLDEEQPDALWRSRILSIQSAVLGELGLVEEAYSAQLEGVEMSRLSGDPIALASVTHNLGITYLFTDPHQARRQYLETIEIARGFRDVSEHHRRESCALEALAILNLHDLVETYELELSTAELPPLSQAEELAEIGWPELAATIRAARALTLLDAGFVAAARPLVDTLPDPSTMRDVVNAVVVVRVQARQHELEGRIDEAVATLQQMIERTPLRHVVELLGTLVDVLEHAGRYQEALQVAKSQVEGVHKLHSTDSRAAVSALEVWFRTDRAEEDARTATAAAEVLRERTRRDILTGLWNREYLHQLALTQRPVDGHQIAVVDIDGFKQLNDSRGHLAGDEALRAIARALVEAVDPHDITARFGGDEFVVIRHADQPGSLADDLGAFLTDPVLPEHGVSASIGVVRSTVEGFESALEAADACMYRAKRAGGRRIFTA